MKTSRNTTLPRTSHSSLLPESVDALHSDDRGQGMTEYVIVLVAIAVVCIGISVEFGGKIKGHFENASLEVDGIDQNF